MLPRKRQGWADLVWTLDVKVPASAEKVESEEHPESCDSEEKPREEKQEETEKAESSPTPLVKGGSWWLRRTQSPHAGSPLSCSWDFGGAVAPSDGTQQWHQIALEKFCS